MSFTIKFQISQACVYEYVPFFKLCIKMFFVDVFFITQSSFLIQLYFTIPHSDCQLLLHYNFVTCFNKGGLSFALVAFFLGVMHPQTPHLLSEKVSKALPRIMVLLF